MKSFYRFEFCFEKEVFLIEEFSSLSSLISFINNDLKDSPQPCLYYQAFIVTLLDDLTEGDGFGECPSISRDKNIILLKDN